MIVNVLKISARDPFRGDGGGGEEKWECCGENFGENCMFIQVIMMLCVHFHCQKH